MKTRFLAVLHIWGIPLLLLGVMLSASATALPYGAGKFGTCQYGSCSINVLSDATVNLSVTPTVAGAYTTVSSSVSVSTNSSTGYTLTVRDSNTDTDLINGSQTIDASSGTQASPIALAMNTWGYRVDGLASFGSGPTSAQSSASSSSYTFAGIPASNQSAHTLKTTSVEANPADVSTVWFGARIDSTKPSGTYSGQVTYTAVTNE